MGVAKRRTIWISDADWALISGRANRLGCRNVSELVRTLRTSVSSNGRELTLTDLIEPRPRPFTPVPKPGKR